MYVYIKSGQISTFSGTVGSHSETVYSYTYDNDGNITGITKRTGTAAANIPVASYQYDKLGQLVRENNYAMGETYIYTYDDGGNITSKKTYPYSFGTLGSCKSSKMYEYYYPFGGDRLIKYAGDYLTYDSLGNPLYYYNGNSYNFTWTNGRRLATATKGSDTLSFTYNDEGIRTSKTVNGVVHTYYLNGTQILAEEWGTELLIYLYDAEGSPMGMQYRNASWYKKDAFDTYWFEKNLQGDIIAVYTAAGLKVCSYVYDAWGNFNIIMDYDNGVGSGDAWAVNYNPFRYRGYYYDTELGMYYLQSRYYDPVTCRFINADGLVSTGQGLLGYNMFAYCGNNPVCRVDFSGRFWGSIWSFLETAILEIGEAIGVLKPVYAGLGGVAVADGPVPIGDIICLTGSAIVTVGAVVSGTYQAVKTFSKSDPKVQEKEKEEVIPKKPDSPLIFPVDPNNFYPFGLVKILRPGTRNGSFISWMDPLTNTEVFRWDENPNYFNGPHYHIYGTGHYTPGVDIVPEPYASVYFPLR